MGDQIVCYWLDTPSEIRLLVFACNALSFAVAVIGSDGGHWKMASQIQPRRNSSSGFRWAMRSWPHSWSVCSFFYASLAIACLDRNAWS